MVTFWLPVEFLWVNAYVQLLSWKTLPYQRIHSIFLWGKRSLMSLQRALETYTVSDQLRMGSCQTYSVLLVSNSSPCMGSNQAPWVIRLRRSRSVSLLSIGFTAWKPDLCLRYTLSVLTLAIRRVWIEHNTFNSGSGASRFRVYKLYYDILGRSLACFLR